MKDNKRLKRRVRNSYIVSTVSMALVLFPSVRWGI